MHWADLERFPESSGKWETIEGSKNVVVGEANARKKAARWFPLNTTLYASPASQRFSLAICFPELADFVHRRYVLKFRLLLFFLIFLLAVLIGLSIAYDSYTLFSKSYGFVGILFIVFFFEYEVFVKSKTKLVELSLFFHWILSRKSYLFWMLFGMTLCSGVFQVVYLTKIGSLESLVTEYGVYYRSANSGEWWRYFLGSFVHRDFAHWLANFFLLLIAAILAGPFSRISLIFYFFIFIAVSAYVVQFPLYGVAPDALVGISGGVFGLYGWIIGNGFRYRRQFPQSYYLHVAMFVLPNIFIAAILNPNSSSEAHIVGLLVGAIFGVAGASEDCKAAST